MTIFEALRQSHELQRTLTAKMLQTSGDTPDRHSLFATLKDELAVHALAEEQDVFASDGLLALGADVDVRLWGGVGWRHHTGRP